MVLRSNNLKRAALLFSAILIGIGLLGTLVFISYSARKSQKGFENLSAPAPITSSFEASPQTTPSSTPVPSFDLPAFLKPPVTNVKNNNIQLKPNPSQEDIKTYIAEVKRVATSAMSVIIDNCEPNPVIVQAAELSNISFVNNDEATRLITVADKRFAIEARSTREIPMSFASGTGIYNYDCDSNFSVGTLWIE